MPNPIAPRTTQTWNSTPQSSASGNGQTYTVQRNDSLYLIGRRFGISAEALAAANGLSLSNPIYPGQVLRIPAAKPSNTYVVQPGDSLYTIGRRFGVSAEAIAAANGIPAGGYIYPGQSLRIPAAAAPATHVVQYGESLWTIGQRYGVTADALAAANGMRPGEYIYPGQVLRLPNSTGPAPSKPAPSTPAPTAPSGLSTAENAQFTFQQLWPYIQRYSQQYGADPKVVAGIIAQESTFKNHRVHRDGTGHGLIGLDDNGRLPDFERWSGLKIGRGRSAKTIPPEKQIEYLAKTIGDLTRNHRGNAWAAAREWHRGHPSKIWDAAGSRYEQLIRAKVRELF